jgi:hypothetical protein
MSFKQKIIICAMLFLSSYKVADAVYPVAGRRKIRTRGIILYALVLLGTFFVLKPAYGAITIRPMLNTGLVGYWAMDEGHGLLANDLSGSRNGLNLFGIEQSAAWPDGKMGKALNFDGNSYASSTDDTSIDFRSSMTLSLWIYPTQNIGYYTRLIDKDYFSSYFLGADAGISSLGFWMNNNNIASTSNDVVATNTWQMITVTYDRNTGDAIIYHNAVSRATGNYLGSLPGNSKSVVFGKRNTSNAYYYNGYMDDIRFYNRALPAAEVTRLYNLTRPKFKAATSQGLVGYWAMDEGQGTIAGDMSGKGNTGDITSATWTDGKRGKALSFDGTNAYVSINGSGSSMNNISSSFTLSTWVRFNSLNADRTYIIEKGSPNGSNFYIWWDAGNSRWDYGFRNSQNTLWKDHFYANTPALNVWHHVMFVFNDSGNTADLYLNGALVRNDAETDSPDYGGANLILGDDYPLIANRRLNGQLDEVRIYNRALSATEVANLYTSSKKIFKVSASQNNKLTDGLIGMWSFNGPDISGTTVFDRSSQGNNGTLVNGPVVTIGKVGQAIDLSGSTQRVFVGTQSSLDNNNTLTWTAWARAEGNPNNNYGPVFEKGNGSNERKKFQFSQSDPGSTMNAVSATFFASTTNAVSQSVNGTYSLNEWAFWTVTYDDNGDRKIRIYKNAEEVTYLTQQAAVGALTDDASQFFIIGGQPPSGFYSFNGVLDEARVYNRVLTAAEIKRMYEMGK